MSAIVLVSKAYSMTTSTYGVCYSDGTVEEGWDGMPASFSLADAQRRVADQTASLSETRIPQNLWPKVVKFNQVVTFTGWTEVTA